MAPASPTVARWEFALRLRRRRKELGLEVKTISERLGFSRNYWSLVENERAILTEVKLEALADLFEFDDGDVQELLELRKRAGQRGWWESHSHLFDEDQLRFFGLEHGANSVKSYEALLIVGLLQTEEYARAVVEAHPTVSQVSVTERVQMRLRRQERLTGTDPLRLTAVMSEAALMQQIGGPDTLCRQLFHILDMAGRFPELIGIRVLPFTANPGGMIGASTLYLLDFPSSRLPALAWQESSTSIGIIENSDSLQALEVSYAQAIEASLSRRDSLDLIRRTAEGLA